MALVPSLNFSDKHNIGLLRFGGQPATNQTNTSVFIPTHDPIARYTVTRFWWLNQNTSDFTGGGFDPLNIVAPPLSNVNNVSALVTPFVNPQGTYDLLFSEDFGNLEFYSAGMVLAKVGSAALTTILVLFPDTGGSTINVNPWSSPSVNGTNYSSTFIAGAKPNVKYWLRTVINRALGFTTFLYSQTGAPGTWLQLTQQTITTLGDPNWVGFFANPNDAVGAGATATVTLSDWGYSTSINIQAQASRSVVAINDVLNANNAAEISRTHVAMANTLVARQDFKIPYAYALATSYRDVNAPFGMLAAPFFGDVQVSNAWNSSVFVDYAEPTDNSIVARYDAIIPYESLAYIPPNCVWDNKVPVYWGASPQRDINTPLSEKSAIREDVNEPHSDLTSIRYTGHVPLTLQTSVRADWLTRLLQRATSQRDVNVPSMWKYGILREDLIIPVAVWSALRADNVVPFTRNANMRRDLVAPVYTTGASQAVTLNVPTSSFTTTYYTERAPFASAALSVKEDAIISLSSLSGVQADIHTPLTWKISVVVSWDAKVPVTWGGSTSRTGEVLFSSNASIAVELIVPAVWIKFEPPFDRTTYALNTGGYYGGSPSRVIIERGDVPPYKGVIE